MARLKARVIIVDRYHRSDLRRMSDVLFVFGDNLDGRGFGGQAKECRGEPNAVGIPTKRHPSMDASAFFCDADLRELRPIFQERFRRLSAHLSSGGDVVWPVRGVGSGLSDLPARAPQIFAYLNRCYAHLLAIAAGSRRAKTPKAVECEASQSGGEAVSP